MGYFSDLVSSFSPGGQTPLQALLGLPEDVDSFSDYIEYQFGDDRHSNWSDYVFGDATLPSPNDASNVGDNGYYEELSREVDDAVEKQNTAAQSSADRAMEFEKEQAELNRTFQAEQAQKAMDYQTEMSNTAYQRAMSDMKAAGLNPKLVAQLGGASTPSGVAGSGAQGSGHIANMSMSNVSALSGVLQSYISSSTSLDNKSKDFVQDMITTLILVVGSNYLPALSTVRKIGF